VVRKGHNQSEMVLQIPAAIVIVGIAIGLAEVDVEKPKAENENENGFRIEKKVIKEFNSDVDNVQVRLPTSLNSKQMQLVAKSPAVDIVVRL
jgi:uncharacterized protein (UPF0333 family)